MSKFSPIPQGFYSIDELALRWGCTKDEVLHQVGLGYLEVSVRYYGDKIAWPIIGREVPLTEEETSSQSSENKSGRKGFYQIYDGYIQELIHDGEVYVDSILCESGRKSIIFNDGLKVTINELVITFDEVDRFESAHLHSPLVEHLADTHNTPNEFHDKQQQVQPNEHTAFLSEDTEITEGLEEKGGAQQNQNEQSIMASVSISVIANIFRIDKDEAINLKKWKDFAHYADRNDLIVARTKKGAGKSPSLFDPMKVGDWLVKSMGLFSQEQVYIKLKKNLPIDSPYHDYFGVQ